MDFLQYSPNTLKMSASRAEKKLKKAEESHQQLQFKLLDRVQALSIQMNLIKSSLPEDPIFRMKTLPRLQRNQQKIKQMLEIKRKQQNELSSFLMREQVNLQGVAHLKSLIKQYEARMFQMSSNLYSKEVDISVDHIGKRENEKPSLRLVKEFSRTQNQFNIFQKLIFELAKVKKQLTKAATIEKLHQHRTNINIGSIKSDQIINHQQITQNVKTKEIDEKQVSSSFKQETLKTDECPITQRKLILTNGEKKKMMKNKEEPTYDYLLALLRDEIKREQKLKEEYLDGLTFLKKERKKKQKWQKYGASVEI